MSKQSFESFIVEFKENRENVINILKIVIEQKKVEEFKNILKIKEQENLHNMKDFIKSKYYDFVESIQNINECKQKVKETDDSLFRLEDNIQVFLAEFSKNYLDKIRKKENLMNIKKEKEMLNLSYIFFAHMNKASIALKEQQFELTIRLINLAYEKYLKKFHVNSKVYRRGEQVINNMKSKITLIIEDKLTKWLVEINKEQLIIGETLYKRVKSDHDRIKLNEFEKSGRLSKSNIRATKNIVENLLLIRNTSNLNYMMNKNSLLKTSVMAQAEILEEFDIINMVSNVDLNFLEQAYSIYKQVDIDTKFIEYFRNFRQSQIQTIIKFDKNYDIYFSDLLGFIILQIAIFELLPIFYTKRKFEEIMNYLFKELQNNISYEFDVLLTHEDYIRLSKSISVFMSSIERIGISERIGIDLRSSLVEILKDKIKYLNFILIRKYNNIFVNQLFEEKCINIEVHNQEEFIKYASQYSITLDDNSKPISGMIYPFKLPYTNFVIEVNENFKKYVNEIFEYIQPIYTEYDAILPEVVRDFLKKLNEVFITFSNNSEQELNIILTAQICNNIRFILKSYNFYSNFIIKIGNIKSPVKFDSERSLKEAWQSYEEIIYETLKRKLKQFISDLNGEDWMPDRKNSEPNMYVQGMKDYLQFVYLGLQSLSDYYIQSCFKDALNFISKIFFEILLNSEIVKEYNYYAMENIKLDIDVIDSYFKDISLTHPGFNECLLPIKTLINVFIQKKFDILLDKNKNLETFFDVKVVRIAKFFLKYKNLKKSSDMKGKISESDLSGLVKKMKEFHNLSIK